MFRFSDIGLSTDIVLLGALAVIVILLILSFVMIGKNSSLRKKYEEFMRDADGKSLESAFQKKFENMDFINERAAAAAENYEKFRREGKGVIESEELTISILTNGIEDYSDEEL